MRVTIKQDEAHMTTPELIESHGYAPETHHIWTKDDYRLEVHRVSALKDRTSFAQLDVNIGSTNEELNLSAFSDLRQMSEVFEPCTNEDSKIPVLIVHGLLSSSADWVLLGPHKALAYVLYNNGFDVWLGNTRGNTYSRCHKHYSVKDGKFWDFSWHEIGCYDLPAMIDYILDETGHSKLYYVGYSQGTTAFYVMASERTEYNAKIKGMISLAPIAYLANQKSPLLKYVVRFHYLMKWGSSICNINQCFPRNKWWQIRILGSFIRKAPNAMTKSFCTCWFYLIAGFGSDQLDKSMLPLILGHFPAGASVKQMLHFSQIIVSNSFQKYDYGAKLNRKIYGSTEPPKYNLKEVQVPMTIFYSCNDFLTHPIDVQRLIKKLPDVRQVIIIKYEKFNHIDYLWGRDAKTLLYNNIIKALKRF